MEEKSKNDLQRLGEKFISEMVNIQQKRLEIGMDKKKKSIKWLSNLLVRHKAWDDIKLEMMEFRGEFNE